jgi:uncharacterized membrane protein YphA (DoxX/SURF4 family)
MFELVLVAARLALALVLALAGISKLAAQPEARKAMAEFGAPERLVPSLAVAVPLAELAAAAALLPGGAVTWGGLGALGLLLVFTAAIAFNVARGRRPDCRCFGALHRGTTGPRSLIRNAALLVVAAFIVVASLAGTTPDVWDDLVDRGGWAGVTATALALALLVARSELVFDLLTRSSRLVALKQAFQTRARSMFARRRVARGRAREGLPIGSDAPHFFFPTADGESLTLASLLQRGRKVLLLFPAADRSDDAALLSEVAAAEAGDADELTVVIVGHDKAEPDVSNGYGLRNVLLSAGRQLHDAYHVDLTPSAVLVNPDGKIGSRTVAGSDAIQELVFHAVAPDPAGAAHAPAGSSPGDV